MRTVRFVNAILFKPHKVLIACKFLLKAKYIQFVLGNQKIEGEFVFVTGADSSHFRSAIQFLESFLRHETQSKIIFYDLGLKQQESQVIRDRFKNIKICQFDYSKYPDYFNIKINTGEYAWKPVIIWQTLMEYKCKVVWMDAGNVVIDKLENLKRYICLKGYFWNNSPGTIKEWTHPKTLSYLNVPEELYSYRNLSSGTVAFDYHNKKAREVAHEWKQCAMHKECIGPDGSDRSNHRQDQAALTVLVHKKGLGKGFKLKNKGFIVQQDID